MPDKDTKIEQILRKAIQFEEAAFEFYTSAVEMVQQPHIKSVLQDLAAEEVKHKERLQKLLEGNVQAIVAVRKRDQIQDLKLAEYLVSQPLGPDATFQDVLIVAMHREKSSNEFYSVMASIAEEGETKDLFAFLAQEELGHKNRIEKLYDEFVYQEF
jgi:rubrerythrin